VDKYEFNIKVEKMKKAMDRKDYVTAARVADGLGWERSTNAKVLMMVSQIYEKQERYAEARSALTAVYNRVAVSKRIIYQLAELCVKCGDIDEALALYKEYQEIAPSDPTKLILAYKISTARGDDLEKRISILEAYRRRDFEEKWAYELATLYQQAGRGSDCVSLCDEIILWFGVGPYVDKAMTLKVAYEPLTPEQEDRRANKDYYEQKLAEVVAQSTSIVHISEEPETAFEAIHKTPEVKPDSFDHTVSMQEEGSADDPSASPAVKEAALHLTLEQELAQAIQSTSDELTTEAKSNEWITDKPLSVDNVGEDVDGQYTLFRTPSEEIGEPHVPEHTRTFSFGALLTKTRRLDNLRDLAELNHTEDDKAKEAVVDTPIEKETEAVVKEPIVEEAETVVEEAIEEKNEAAVEEPIVEEAEAVVEEAIEEKNEAAVEEPIVEEAKAVVEEAVEEKNEAVVEEAVAEDSTVSEEAAELHVEEEAPRHMIFCHILKLEDSTPAVTQIKDAFRQAHEVSGIPAAPIARIGVNSLNRAGFYAVLKKLQGRDLLVEHASELSEKVLERLLGAIEEPPCTAVILLADDPNGISILYQKAPALFPLSATMEEEVIEEEVIEEDPSETEESSDEISFDLEGFMKTEMKALQNTLYEETPPTDEESEAALTPDEFASVIYEYTLENDCKFDSMAELALAAHIDRLELQGAKLSHEFAIAIADEIIDRADHWTLKSIFVSRYDREGYLIIKESHIR